MSPFPFVMDALRTTTDCTHNSVPHSLSDNVQYNTSSNVREKCLSPTKSPVQNTVVDIRQFTSPRISKHSSTVKLRNKLASTPLEEEALQIYKRITSFDATVDKALGKFNKHNKIMSIFGKPSTNYSFIREPNFDNILQPLLKSGFIPIQDLYNLKMYTLYTIICTKQFIGQ